MTGPQSWIGIDVAKAHLDIARSQRPGQVRVANTAAGWQRLLAELAGTEQPQVVVEATGPYHRGLVVAVRPDNCPVATSVVNSRRVA